MNQRVHVAAAVLLAMAALADCKFEPAVKSGSLACDQSRCPPGLSCRLGVCCAPEDPMCPAFADAAAGAPDAAVTDGPSAPGPDAAAMAAPDGGSPTSPVTQVLSGVARLIGWKDACTLGGGGAGQDRWCAFYRGAELWVVNITRAIAPGGVRCDGSDASCLMLTGTAFRGDAAGYRGKQSRFRGDLLLYYADARPRPPDVPFRGGVFAWHPGWTVGRRLTSADGEECTVNTLDSTTVACLQNSDGTSVDVIGGRLTADSVLPLPTINRTLRDRNTVRVTDAGDYILYSFATATDQVPSLYLVPAGQVTSPGARTLIATGALVNGISGNGTRAFYMAVPKVADLKQPSALMRVDLPSGKNPVELATGVGWGRGLESKGRVVGFTAFSNVDDDGYADVKLFADARMAPIPFGRAFISSIRSSADATVLLFESPHTAPQSFDEARILDVGTGTGCLLGPAVDYTPDGDRFSKDNRLVFWMKALGVDAPNEGWISSTADCKAQRKLGDRVSTGYWLGEAGMVFQDDVGAGGGTIRLLGPLAQLATAAPSTLAEGADQPFSVIASDPESLVVFTSTVAGRQGLHVARVPF